jgi:NitT/TauT family transport system substrate-binding protein
MRRAILAQALIMLACMGTAAGAHAEVSEVRLTQQFGLPYLPLMVMSNQRLIEKNAEAQGLGTLKVTWARLGGGAASNDALLSGSVDFVSAGVSPLLVIYDRTKGNLAFLNTSNPNIKSIKDFSDKDRIAVPSVKVSIQAVWLQIAAEQAFGAGQHGKLDPLTVTLPHPEATTALLSGKSEITAHFVTAPFNYLQLNDARIRRITTSDEILGGQSSNTFLFTTSKFRNENPKVYKAVFDAVRQAHEFIARNPAEAAKIFVSEERSNLSSEAVQKILAEPTNRYSLVPLNTMKIADFLTKIGTLKTRPASWKEYTFPELHSMPGS